MILQSNINFWLHTANTSYGMRVCPTGQVEHLYYGRKLRIEETNVQDVDSMMEKHVFAPGNTVCYDAEHESYSLEDLCLEMSSYGKGDIREPFVQICHSDGARTSDFVYVRSEIRKGRGELETLPSSYGSESQVSELVLYLKDRTYQTTLELHYCVYEAEDVITRHAVLINDTEETIRVDRLMSLQLDLDRKDYVVSSFQGAWAREMQMTETKVSAGKYVISSMAGTSSNRANPFFMLSKEHTTEDHGECYGFNLIYSGNHYEAIEVNSYGKTRVVTGINPDSFEYQLKPKERLESPEAVMTYSANGKNCMSQNLHHFIREHILHGIWSKKERPILLNSWEAAYFDINEKKLLSFAKAAKEVGIELFVMDDGWFGTRDDDKQSLGDWQENAKKLPNGVKGLAEKINAIGMEFGIWVEPEMVNVNSRLYQEHPEWVVDIPGASHAEGRNQRILDLSNPEVQDYMINEMSRVFSSANIAYVKWDMNRIFSDTYSKYLPLERKGEFSHRYVLGLYRMMKELTRRFPKILFEGCCAGGNRFDLGILSYFPQIWASDNTDAACRVAIQNSYSYGYPQCVVSAHVSGCPNHQTLRRTPLETRFNVAAFGVLGYECNFSDLSKEEKEAVKEQIALYKQWRSILQYGDFYRGRSGNLYEWTIVAPDQKKAVGMIMQNMVRANDTRENYYAKGLREDVRYHFYNRAMKHNIKNFGDLINTQIPIHIRPDSVAHNMVAKFVKMDGETEDYTVYGDSLMYAGIGLQQGFAAAGYNDKIRFFPDYASRIYFMEEV